MSLLGVSGCFWMSQGISMCGVPSVRWEKGKKMTSKIDSAETTSWHTLQSWRWKRLWHIINLSDGKWRRTTINWHCTRSSAKQKANERRLRQTWIRSVCVCVCVYEGWGYCKLHHIHFVSFYWDKLTQMKFLCAAIANRNSQFTWDIHPVGIN